jgi:hypothetical protein
LNRPVSFCDTKDPDDGTTARLVTLFETFQLTNRSAGDDGRLAQTSVTIPVHFHVISRGPSFEEGEVPDAFLIEQIDLLNRSYAGQTGGVSTPFKFFLAGINRVRNADWHVLSPGSSAEIDAKRALKVGGAETMNVYLADIVLEGQEGTILGYSTLPVFYNLLESFDGIVLNFRAVPGGPIANYDLGNTLVHEAGHWLGLLHTFTGSCDGLFSDLVGDTPREAAPTQYCPPDGFDSCPGLEGSDPIHNHMTYTADACRTEFTPGQVDFMSFNATIFRGLSTF